MNKRKVGRTFSRKRDQRKAFLRSLLRSLVLRGRIKTTETRAKELKSLADRLVTHAKKKSLASHRYLAVYLGDAGAKKLIAEAQDRLRERVGGYTRVLKMETRKSDSAKMAIIEFVE